MAADDDLRQRCGLDTRLSEALKFYEHLDQRGNPPPPIAKSDSDMSIYKCPHCGWEFTTDHPQYVETSLVPTHDWPRPCRQVCPGSKQNPRNAQSDMRQLWKDLPSEST